MTALDSPVRFRVDDVAAAHLFVVWEHVMHQSKLYCLYTAYLSPFEFPFTIYCKQGEIDVLEVFVRKA